MTPQGPPDPTNPYGQSGSQPEPLPPAQPTPYPQQPYQPAPPPGYQQTSPYGAPGGYPGPPGVYPEQANGTMILVLGIVSILCLQIILGPIAWVMGNNATAAINAGRANPAELSNVSAGRICGIVGTVLGVVGIIGWIVYASVFASLYTHMPPQP